MEQVVKFGPDYLECTKAAWTCNAMQNRKRLSNCINFPDLRIPRQKKKKVKIKRIWNKNPSGHLFFRTKPAQCLSPPPISSQINSLHDLTIIRNRQNNSGWFFSPLQKKKCIHSWHFSFNWKNATSAAFTADVQKSTKTPEKRGRNVMFWLTYILKCSHAF